MANGFKLRKSWRTERNSSGGWAAEWVRSRDGWGPGVRDGVRDGQWGCGLKGSMWDVTHHESESEVAHSCPTLCDPMDGSLPEYWPDWISSGSLRLERVHINVAPGRNSQHNMDEKESRHLRNTPEINKQALRVLCQMLCHSPASGVGMLLGLCDVSQASVACLCGTASAIH